MKSSLYFIHYKYIKLQLLLLPLLIAFQRSPLTRFATMLERSVKVPFARLIQMSIATFAAAGTQQAVTGATTFTSNPSSPITIKTGERFELAFAVTGAPSSVKSWKVKGTLPKGLSIPGLSGQTVNTRVGTITGTPTEVGSFQITVQAYEKSRLRGHTNKKAYPISITVEQGIIAPPDTVFTANPSADQSATVGESFSMSFGITGLNAASWRLIGALPDGLQLSGPNDETLSGDTLNAVSGVISGTPTKSGPYSFSVQAYDAIDLKGLTDEKQHPLSITVATPTFNSRLEEWKFNHFGTISASDTADPDRDGAANLLEYALGRDPNIHDPNPDMWQSISTGRDQTRMQLNFERIATRNDIDIVVEATPSLQQPWTTIATSSKGDPFTGLAEIEESNASNSPIQVSIFDKGDLQEESARFLRIRVLPN